MVVLYACIPVFPTLEELPLTPELKPSLGTPELMLSSSLFLTHHISSMSKPLLDPQKEIPNVTHFIISLLGPNHNHTCLDYYSSPQVALLLSLLLCDSLTGARVIF